MNQFEESQTRQRSRGKQDLHGIFHILNSRSHLQVLRQFGKDGLYRRSRNINPGGRNKDTGPLPEVDPDTKASLLLQSIVSRHDLGLILDRLYARVSAVKGLNIGQFGPKINELAAVVDDVQQREKKLDVEVTKIRESHGDERYGGSTDDRLAKLAEVQTERSRGSKKLREVKSTLLEELATPSLKGYAIRLVLRCIAL